MAIVFRGNRSELRRLIDVAVGALSGRTSDTDGVGIGFLTAIGFAALSDVKTAFIEKAGGGVDELGIRWPPLKPETIANRRVGPKDKRDNRDIAKRERIRQRETAKAFKRFSLSLPEKEARRRAAIVGGLKATRQTGKTKVQTLGGRQVEILRDTGVLLNSLSPGLVVSSGSGASYQRPEGEGGEEQIFRVKAGEVVVGTNVKYASTHQRGDSSRGIPARPFLPPDNGVPDIWWARWLSAGNKALAASLAVLVQRGAR